MSVLIKGIKMPENCSECPLEYDQMMCRVAGHVWFDQDYLNIGFDSTQDRLPECPLVELQEHHGRIIDEDEIIVPSLSSWSDQAMVADAIQDAPTVIEAE